MATNYSGLTLDIRAEVKDLVYSNPVINETLGGEQYGTDGTNTIFYLQNKNIVSGLVSSVQYGPWVTLGANKRSLAGGAAPFTLDTLNGIITMTSAPTAGQTPFFVDYYFQWFQDADYQYWIDQATQELGQVLGSFTGPVANGGDLTPALVQYCVERYWTARASQYATKYATSTQGASEQIQTVTQNFLGLAKAARTKGDALRKNAYIDPGQKIKPASGTITYGFERRTPRR